MWLRFIGVVIALGVGAAIVFLLIEAALVAWGVLGALLAIFVVILAAGWYMDRRRATEYAD
jgi:membrane protein implicated in regulation of membrane protease activity